MLLSSSSLISVIAFDEVPFITVFFYSLCFLCSDKCLSNSWISLLFTCRSFILLAFMFRFLTYFQLIFVELRSQVPSFPPHPIVPAWFDDKTILSPFIYLSIFVKTQWTMYVWIYFWTFYSVLLVYMFILILIPHLLIIIIL